MKTENISKSEIFKALGVKWKFLSKIVFWKKFRILKNQRLKDSIYQALLKAELAIELKELKNIKKLKGYTSYYRLRIGDYRIGLKWMEDNQELYFVTFGHRKGIY